LILSDNSLGHRRRLEYEELSLTPSAPSAKHLLWLPFDGRLCRPAHGQSKARALATAVRKHRIAYCLTYPAQMIDFLVVLKPTLLANPIAGIQVGY
jgi:hypothetical protein